MSSIENSIKAVVDGDISGIPPESECSRVELYLRYILDKETKLPKPLSRIEKLLHNIVTKFNGSVEPKPDDKKSSNSLFDSSKKEASSDITTHEDTASGIALMAEYLGYYPVSYAGYDNQTRLTRLNLIANGYKNDLGITAYLNVKSEMLDKYCKNKNYFITDIGEKSSNGYDPYFNDLVIIDDKVTEKYESEISDLNSKFENEEITELEFYKGFYDLMDRVDTVKSFQILSLYDHFVEKISLPNINVVPMEACYRCGCLKEFSAPKAESVGTYAFNANMSLEYVDISSCINIGREAFRYDHRLKNILMPNVENIGYAAFANCFEIEQLDIDNCKIIGREAFAVVNSRFVISKLKVVNARSVEFLGDSAFAYHKNLTEIHLGPLSEGMHNDALKNCEKIKCLTIPKDNSVGFLYLEYSTEYTQDVLHELIENLYDMTKPLPGLSFVQTGIFKVGLENIQKIDAEHIAILNSKNWDYS